MVTKGWDDPVNDVSLKLVMTEVLKKCHDNPAQGDWSVTGEELNAWVDASSLVTIMMLERHGAILEDVYWFRLANLGELNATLKSLNLVL